MKKSSRQVEKEIWDSLSIEDKLHETMLQKIRQLILKGHADDAVTVGSASKILFPKKGDAALYDTVFEALWKRKQYKQALRAYYTGKRPFWRAEVVGRYYERQGLIMKAMAEYEHLIKAYSKMGSSFLPLPGGPVELFKLGQWYAVRNTKKAKKYLTLYLKAEDDKCGTGRGIRHKKKAQALLKEL